MQVAGSFFGLSLGVTLDFGKVIFFAPSLGTKGSYSTLPEIFQMTTTYSDGKKQGEGKGVGEVNQPVRTVK